ncbi:MAG TPA: pyridoxal-phosphate dependent enzyme [Longimicrobiales bacterium]
MLSELMQPSPDVGDIAAAADRIRGAATRTPLEHSPWLSRVAGAPVYLKLESAQPTRSFKQRGAANAIALLDAGQRARGVVTASAGNHGLAVAYAAARSGVTAKVYVPAGAPSVKKERIRALGAELDETSANYDAAEAAAASWAAANGAHFLHAFSDPAVVAGQGTVGLEILEDLPEVANVIVPVGGGGLAAGVGLVLRGRAPQVRLVGVQSTETRAMYDAYAAGGIVPSPITPTLADGLAGCTDEAAYARLRPLLGRIDLVPEGALLPAIRAAFEMHGIVMEGAAAVGIAALLSGAVHVGGPTAIIITGGNIDGAVLARALLS